jgi:hypothetical protein
MFGKVEYFGLKDSKVVAIQMERERESEFETIQFCEVSGINKVYPKKLVFGLATSFIDSSEIDTFK